jgi:hypothetical protein
MQVLLSSIRTIATERAQHEHSFHTSSQKRRWSQKKLNSSSKTQMNSVFNQLKEKRRSVIEPPSFDSDGHLADVDTTECDQEILLDYFENEVHERKRLERKALKKESLPMARLWRPRRLSIFGQDGEDVEIQSLKKEDRHRRAAIIVKQLQNGTRPNWNLLRNASDWRITLYIWHRSPMNIPLVCGGRIPFFNWNYLVIATSMLHTTVVTAWEEKCKDAETRNDAIPHWPVHLELVCLSIYIIDVLWELLYLGWHKFYLRKYKHFHNHGRNVRMVYASMVVVLACGTAIRTNFGYEHPFSKWSSCFSKPLRPLILMTRVRGEASSVCVQTRRAVCVYRLGEQCVCTD